MENTITHMYSPTSYEEVVATRKANYWRGFRACLILVVIPLGIIFVLFCHALTGSIL